MNKNRKSNNSIYEYKYKGLLSKYLEHKRITEARQWIIGPRILDMGCEKAKTLEYLDEPVEYVGIDISENIINYNKNRYPGKSFFKIDLNRLDLFKVFLKERKFNSILFLAVIEHLKFPKEIIEILSTKLFLRGKLIITTPHPFGENIINIGSKFHIFAREGIEQHQSLIHGAELIDFANKSGMTLIQSKRFNLWLNQLFVFEKISQ